MNKIKSIFILAFFFLLVGKSNAQEFRLTPIYGYTFQDRIPLYEGDGYIRDASSFGGLLQFMPHDEFAISFLYKYSKPEFDFKSYSYFYDDINNVQTAINYFMFGATRFFNNSDNVVSPFGSFYAGWSTWIPDGNYSSFSRFSLGFDLGASVKITDFLGFNLRSEMLLPIQGFGTGIYCGTGGCGASFDAVTSVTQFSFTGGVEIRLAPKAKSTDYYTY